MYGGAHPAFSTVVFGRPSKAKINICVGNTINHKSQITNVLNTIEIAYLMPASKTNVTDKY